MKKSIEIIAKSLNIAASENLDKALTVIYGTFDFEQVEDDIKNGYLTSNECRNHVNVLWYLDESREVCVNLENLKELNSNEIAEQLL